MTAMFESVMCVCVCMCVWWVFDKLGWFPSKLCGWLENG